MRWHVSLLTTSIVVSFNQVPPWALPILLVNKKDGSVRMLVDYRGLNAVIVDELFDQLRGAKYICKIFFCVLGIIKCA